MAMMHDATELIKGHCKLANQDGSSTNITTQVIAASEVKFRPDKSRNSCNHLGLKSLSSLLDSHFVKKESV